MGDTWRQAEQIAELEAENRRLRATLQELGETLENIKGLLNGSDELGDAYTLWKIQQTVKSKGATSETTQPNQESGGGPSRG